jgi:type I restriction enzyme S subunit
MSRIDDLIKRYCPDGVELKELSKVLKPKENINWKSATDSTFQYIDLSSVDRVTHKISGTTEINAKTAPSRAKQIVRSGDVIFGTTRPTLKRFSLIGEDYDGQIASTGFCVLRPNDEVLTNFLFHLIGSSNFNDYVEFTQKGASYPSISDAEVKRFKIPVPPIEVQNAIVDVLDSFAELEAELEVKLEAELEARGIQYSFYRDQLLSFEATNVKWMTVHELYDFKNGLNKGKEFFGKGTPIINFTDVFKNRLLTFENVSGKVEVSNKEKMLYGVKKDDIFLTRTSETRDEIGMACALLEDIEDCVFSGFVLRARPKTKLLNPEFVSYYLASHRARKEIIRYSTFTTRALTSGKRLSKIKIPVPPMQEQERIVDILKKFDNLTTNISETLPAEINVRRKQYEYYRNKLLTFQELTV